MAEHDQELQTKIIALQQKVQQLLIHLENTAGTPDAHYELFKNDYSQIHTDLQSIQAHAATFSQNQRTLKQLRLLDQSIEHLESIHREGIKHKDVVGVIDHQLRTAFTALLTLEQAKTRGQPSK